MESLKPSEEFAKNDLLGATTWTAPYSYTHDRYQAYYVNGIGELLTSCGVTLRCTSVHRLPLIMQLLRRIRDSYRMAKASKSMGRAIDSIAIRVAGMRLPPSRRFHDLAGQYEFKFRGGQSLRLVIDAQDAGDIADPSLVEWADVYAKTNYHSDFDYPSHVVPMVNGNPLTLHHQHLLKSLRRTEAKYDLCFVVRVWGGADEESGVEHNLRLLEEISRVKCRKFLLAYLVTGNVTSQERRLREQGIPTTRDPLPLKTLWQISAASRFNVIRLGMHNCIPWRMVDLLAMGARVVLDQAPRTRWPEPLVSGKHYHDLDAKTSNDDGIASGAAYSDIPSKIKHLLSSSITNDAADDISAAYFDNHASPRAVGKHLLSQVMNVGK